MRKHVIGLFLGLSTFAVAWLGTPLAAFHLGRVEAYFDVRQGRKQFKRCSNWGGPGTRMYESMLAEKFGTRTVLVPPCSYYIEHQPSGHWVAGYNTYQAEEIDRLYGEGAFDEAGKQFVREYTRRDEEESGERDRLR